MTFLARLRRDQNGAAGLFSVLTLMVLVLSMGYAAGMADATLEKMKVQDAADAAAYSGARTRGNLYQVYAFLNQCKMVLYRRFRGCKLTDGQIAVLKELAVMGDKYGIPMDPAMTDPNADPITTGAQVAENARQYAEMCHDMQLYLEVENEDGLNNFLHIIESEIQYVAREHGCELMAWSPGGEPVFEPEMYGDRYWGHVVDLGRWVGWEDWDCGIVRPIKDPNVQDFCEPPDVRLMPNRPWRTRVITHRFTHQRNSIKVALRKQALPSTFMPGLLSAFTSTIIGTSAAGCWSPTLNDAGAYEVLYTTDFHAELLSLESAQFRTWLETDDPDAARDIPWVPELVVH